MAQLIPAIAGAGHLIRRPRLTRLLDEADSSLLLLVAPAGYGKTTLAREWIGSRSRTGVWFRVTPMCVDPAALALELAAVLDPFRPGVARHVADHLKVVDAPDPRILGELLFDTEDEWPAATWLVVDDYHVVDASPDAQLLLEIVCRATARVLITTRQRPAWVDARVLLYGEAFELGQSALAMTHDEAEAVLTSAERKPAGIVALANGWPAVIGLAALLPEAVTPTVDVPAELHEFLAQELYDSLDLATRRTLVLLALPDTIDLELVSRVEPGALDFLTQAEARGFLASADDNELEIHPLVRSFLLSKFPEEAAAIVEPVDRLLNCLFERHQWDDALTVIQQTQRREEIRRVIAGGASELLNSGRSATLEQWLAWADERGIEGAEVSLARAELLLRRGDWAAAESLASACATALEPDPSAAAAYLCAGTAAHFQDKGEVAGNHFDHALARDQSAGTRRRAVWGQFVSALSVGSAAINEAEARLQELEDASPAHVLRIQQAHLIIAQRRGDASAASKAGLGALPLAELVEDPLIRSGFLHALATALRISARYEQSIDVAVREMEEAQEARLEFVVPEALWDLAGAKCGQGDYIGAFADIERIRNHAIGADHHLYVNCAVTEARTYLCQRDLESARASLDIELVPELRDEMRGEVFATQAFIAACLRDVDTSAALRSEAQKFPDLVETRVMAAAASAVESVFARPNSLSAALDGLVSSVHETGNYDSAVCTLRAVPSLLSHGMQHDGLRAIIETIVHRTGDAALAGASGIRARPRDASKSSHVSKREIDVLRLVEQGLTNPEVAKELYISEGTVKTHLQNIYEKLGVRTRTQAVVRARATGILRG